MKFRNIFTLLILATILMSHSSAKYDYTFKESLYKTLYNNNVKVYKLEKNGEEYGHAVWMSRKGKKIKAKYFANGEVYRKYLNWKSNKKVISYCTGALANDSRKPIGFTIDNGKMVNRNLNTDEYDGLVIVYATGGIVVSDLDRGSLRIKKDNKFITINPRSAKDKYTLEKWAEETDATIFQTYLLLHNNQLKVKEGRKKRERRILVLAENKSTKEIFHVIFDIKKGVDLKEISTEILNHLKSKNIYVHSALNLDVGTYDMFNIFDQNGNKDYHVKGRIGISNRATNLLVYHYQ